MALGKMQAVVQFCLIGANAITELNRNNMKYGDIDKPCGTAFEARNY